LCGRKLRDLIAGQDKLPDKIHQFVQQVDIHANRFGRGIVGSRFILNTQGSLNVILCYRPVGNKNLSNALTFSCFCAG
jgi:hypothetical protein